MSPTVPFRDTFWNVPSWAQAGLYVGGMVAIAVLAYGMWQRVQLWRQGLPEERLDRIPDRVRLVVRHALLQVRTLSQAYPGIMHAIMFWGFLALFMGTVLATIDWDITLPLFGYKLLKGPFYLVYETVLDLFGLFFVIGLGMAGTFMVPAVTAHPDFVLKAAADPHQGPREAFARDPNARG